MRARRGFALAAALAILGLLAVLAVATLAVTTRLQQGVSLAERDSQLAAAASAALVAPIGGWRIQALSSMTVGETRTFEVSGFAMKAAGSATRLGAELFWIVGESIGVDGSRRRENLIVRLTLPAAPPLAGLVLSGDATLSRSFAVEPDSASGCSPDADLTMRPTASLSSSDGALPPLRVARDATAADSSHALGLDSLQAIALAGAADLVVAPGASIEISSGVTHATGDLTVTGGTGSGVLIVDGALTIVGPMAFDGLVIARELRVLGAGSVLRGGVRVAPGLGYPGSVEAPAGFRLVPSVCAVQSALVASVRPRPVAGRRWAELY